MRNFVALALVALLSVSAFADEKPKKKGKGERGGNPMVTKLTQSLQDVGLSDEQMAKVKSAATTFENSVKELRDQGLTAEVSKKRATAMKEAREAGLKGKEAAAKINGSLTEEEIALLEKMNQAMTQMKKTIASVLTEEQMTALPENVRNQLQSGPRGKGNAEKGKGKGKGKKKDEA